ncbi:MAG: T4SS-associated protein EirA [Endomicrobiales bacterium]|nr:T4SS-associated protein EirA [Endomicrobiales bacterium]
MDIFLKTVAIAAVSILWSNLTIAAASHPTIQPQPNQTINAPAITNNGSDFKIPPEERICPESSALVRDGLWWSANNKTWKSYTQSFAKNIKDFIGAQWAGVVVGKIICLYSGDVATEFPVALEQVTSLPVLEPKGVGWSALTDGHKFCKSSNIADCKFMVQPEENVTDVYKQIEYTGKKTNNNYNN